VIKRRAANERGHTKLPWLDSFHTFSFGEYHDPNHMGFRTLRVINDDFIKPAGGFGTHPHHDMEIVTYLLEGALEHKDSMGNGSIIHPGDVQRMSAGTGVAHSEYNPSSKEPVHLLQIWVLPGQRGLPPGYEQKSYPQEEKRGKLRLIASPDGRDGSVTIHLDAHVYTAILDPGQDVRYRLPSGRHLWIQVARGEVLLNGQPFQQGDGAAVSQEESLTLIGKKGSEVLLFELA